MFCQKCGSKNPDNANFCQGCGSPLNKPSPEKSQEKPPENFYQSPPPTVNPEPAVNPDFVEPKPESPLAALKKVASSALFRFTAFAFCSLILSNILALIDTSFMWGLVSQVLGDIDPSLVNDMSRYLTSISSFGAIVSQIPMIIVAVCLWATYATAASKKDKPFNTAGLTIIKVLYTVELVLTCILLALCMVVLLAASVTSTNADDAMLAFICVIVVDVVFGLAILWLALIIKSLNAAKTAASEEHGKHFGKNASALVGVVCYFMGAVNIVAAIVNLTFLSIVAFCNCAIAAAVQICFGVLIFRFRGEMKKLK